MGIPSSSERVLFISILEITHFLLTLSIGHNPTIQRFIKEGFRDRLVLISIVEIIDKRGESDEKANIQYNYADSFCFSSPPFWLFGECTQLYVSCDFNP
jgi:hypothetical protein